RNPHQPPVSAKPGIDGAAVGKKWRRPSRQTRRHIAEFARNRLDTCPPVPGSALYGDEFRAARKPLHKEIAGCCGSCKKAALQLPVLVPRVEKPPDPPGWPRQKRKLQARGESSLFRVPARQRIEVDGPSAKAIPAGKNRFIGQPAQQRNGPIERRLAPPAAFRQLQGGFVAVISVGREFGPPPRKHRQVS